MSMVEPSIVFDNGPLIQSTAIFAITNLLGCVLSLVGKTQIHVDLLGTGSFALAALPALLGKGAALSRAKISAAAVTLWSVKLAGFLLFRIIKLGEDMRLSDLFASAKGTISFWIFSLLWGVLCSLPHTLASTSSSPGISAATFAGSIVYGIGLIVETTADYQKWMFKAENPGKFCNVGLWSISQHPNWFGNLLIWTGILLMNAPALIDVPAVGENKSLLAAAWRYRRLALAFLSPAFMIFLFKGQADGSLTTTSELAKSKYGSVEYEEYLNRVPQIFPKLF
jgi:steroid 5-alpha reductase family enzyme